MQHSKSHSSIRGALVRALLAVPVLAILPAGSISAAPIISYGVSAIGSSGGQTLYRYTYSISGVVFFQNEELDIQFDPTLYGQLSNGMAPAGFDLLLFQPNDTPGAPGEYSLLALTDNPSVVGAFTVDFLWNGPGLPAAQQYFLYNDNPLPPLLIGSGVTVATVVGTPEPWSWILCISGLAMMGAYRAAPFRSKAGTGSKADFSTARVLSSKP